VTAHFAPDEQVITVAQVWATAVKLLVFAPPGVVLINTGPGRLAVIRDGVQVGTADLYTAQVQLSGV
jgi:hypothetical protein